MQHASSDAATAACDGAVVTGMAAAASPSPSSFPTFFAHACRVGLGVVREYDCASLLAYAEQALVLEQKLATGCFLLQAVLLVEYVTRTTTCDKSQRAERATHLRTSHTHLLWAVHSGGRAAQA